MFVTHVNLKDNRPILVARSFLENQIAHHDNFIVNPETVGFISMIFYYFPIKPVCDSVPIKRLSEEIMCLLWVSFAAFP